MSGYHYSKASLIRLETCHPDLRMLFKSVLPRRDHTILYGKRSKAEQDRLYNLKRSKVMWPHSKHNVTMPDGITEDPDGLSNAIDVAPYFGGQDPPIIWPDPDAGRLVYAKQMGLYYNFAGYVHARADMLGIKVRWGGDWDGDGIYTDQTFEDLVHWELVPCEKTILW